MTKRMVSVLVMFEVILALLSGCEMNAHPNSTGTEETINYHESLVEWPYYETSQELYDAADNIYEGILTEIFFDVCNYRNIMSIKDEMPEDQSNLELRTIYKIQVISAYKNATDPYIYIAIPTGLRNERVDEQIALLKEVGIYETAGIPIMGSFELLEIGETYLFFTKNSPGRYDCIISQYQYAFNDHSGDKYGPSYAELKDYLSKP